MSNKIVCEKTFLFHFCLNCQVSHFLDTCEFLFYFTASFFFFVSLSTFFFFFFFFPKREQVKSCSATRNPSQFPRMRLENTCVEKWQNTKRWTFQVGRRVFLQRLLPKFTKVLWHFVVWLVCQMAVCFVFGVRVWQVPKLQLKMDFQETRVDKNFVLVFLLQTFSQMTALDTDRISFSEWVSFSSHGGHLLTVGLTICWMKKYNWPHYTCHHVCEALILETCLCGTHPSPSLEDSTFDSHYITGVMVWRACWIGNTCAAFGWQTVLVRTAPPPKKSQKPTRRARVDSTSGWPGHSGHTAESDKSDFHTTGNCAALTLSKRTCWGNRVVPTGVSATDTETRNSFAVCEM